MLRIAISTDGESVSPHFGRCPSFTIVDIENNAVVKKETIANPGHHPGFLPQFLHDNGVICIIAGGMGQRARMLFEEKGIQTIMGISGSVDETINNLIQGKLKGSENLCAPRSGKGYGLDRTECNHPQEDK